MERRTYKSLQEWMEATGTNADVLARISGINRPHLSKILTRSRRCSLEKALRLSEITGVPVENLIRWMVRDSQAKTGAAAGG